MRTISKLALGALLAGTALAGCGPLDQPDLLNIHALVTASDGVTPVAGLRIEYYDWIVGFNDGSTIVQRLVSDNPYTDANGHIDSTTPDLNLRSGYTSTDCYYTCSAYDSYGYCLYYVEDCYNSTNYMDIANITAASAQIAYKFGTSFVTTPSQGTTTPAVGYANQTNWVQNDVFVTPFSVTAAGNASAGPHAGGVNAIQARGYDFSVSDDSVKTAPKPEIIPFGTPLSDAQKAAVAKARSHLNSGTAAPAAH